MSDHRCRIPRIDRLAHSRPKNEADAKANAAQLTRPNVFSNCTRPFQFRDSAGLKMVILHPRFRADYSVEIRSQTDRGSGVVEIRGLNNVAPLTLSALGTPVAHGGVPPSAVTIAPITPAQVLSQLLDQTQMNQPEITLLAQARDLANAWRVLKRDQDELLTEMDRITTGLPARATRQTPDCDAVSGVPLIGDLQRCV